MDDEHRSLASDQEVARDTAQDNAIEAGQTTGSDNNEVGAQILCDSDDLGRRIPSSYLRVGPSACFSQALR